MGTRERERMLRFSDVEGKVARVAIERAWEASEFNVANEMNAMVERRGTAEIDCYFC